MRQEEGHRGSEQAHESLQESPGGRPQVPDPVYLGDPYQSHSLSEFSGESMDVPDTRYSIDPAEVLPEISLSQPDRLRIGGEETTEQPRPIDELGLPPERPATGELELGRDDRVELPHDLIGKWPYSALCHLRIYWPSGAKASGTAWLISPRLAITAGHCIYDRRNGGRASQVEVWVGRHGGSSWKGRPAQKLLTNNHYVYYNDRNDGSGEQRYDYGGLVLSEPATNAGTFGFHAYPANEIVGRTVNVVGYPADPPETSNPNRHGWQYGELWGHAAAVTEAQNRVVYYTVDTSGGQSGAPVFRRIPYQGGVRYITVGVHSGETFGGQRNQAVWINGKVSKTLAELKQKYG